MGRTREVRGSGPEPRKAKFSVADGEEGRKGRRSEASRRERSM